MLPRSPSHDAIPALLLLCLLLGGILPLLAATPQLGPPAPIEITQVDLFGLKGWNSMHVSVLGFRLGMGRKEASFVAQAASVTLDDKSGHACLKEKTCSVYSAGKYNGVSLIFNAEDALEKISIEVYQQGASKEEQSAWLMNRFQGKTRQLARDYSENLRLGILGAADIFRASDDSPKSSKRLKLGSSESWRPALVHREHHYSRVGLILAIDAYDYNLAGSDAGTVRKVAFEFARPKIGLP